MTKPPTGDRLQKILSAAGVASRRAAETLIVNGRVSVNGATVLELGTRADPARDDIRVDGQRVRVSARHRYLLLNKPRGYMTTRKDPEGRPTVLDLLPEVREYIYPVGRLDYDSEGLLLLTNDGDLAARLLHPSHEVEREYHARVRGVPEETSARAPQARRRHRRPSNRARRRAHRRYRARRARGPVAALSRAARGPDAAGPGHVRGHRPPRGPLEAREVRPDPRPDAQGGRPPRF